MARAAAPSATAEPRRAPIVMTSFLHFERRVAPRECPRLSSRWAGVAHSQAPARSRSRVDSDRGVDSRCGTRIRTLRQRRASEFPMANTTQSEPSTLRARITRIGLLSLSSKERARRRDRSQVRVSNLRGRIRGQPSTVRQGLAFGPRRPLTALRDLPIWAPLALAIGECQGMFALRSGRFQRGNIHEIPSPA
jgi:hypothetical protein